MRVLPFVLFLGLTALQGELGEGSKYWLYVAKTILGAICVVVVWPLVQEAGVRFSWQAVTAGVAVFLIWVGLDPFYPDLTQLNRDYLCPFWKKIGFETFCGSEKPDHPWNPFLHVSRPLAIFFVAVRILGSSIVVPPIEEFFYRSFLYRYIQSANFMGVPLGKFIPRSFVVTSIVFGFVHNQWLAGILCGAIYQWLAIRTGKLGESIVAHGITNFLLACYIVAVPNQWHFW